MTIYWPYCWSSDTGVVPTIFKNSYCFPISGSDQAILRQSSPFFYLLYFSSQSFRVDLDFKNFLKSGNCHNNLYFWRDNQASVWGLKSVSILILLLWTSFFDKNENPIIKITLGFLLFGGRYSFTIFFARKKIIIKSIFLCISHVESGIFVHCHSFRENKSLALLQLLHIVVGT